MEHTELKKEILKFDAWWNKRFYRTRLGTYKDKRGGYKYRKSYSLEEVFNIYVNKEHCI